MADMHITRELLRAVARGELPPHLLTQVGTQHLMHLCPHCRAEIQAWQRERVSRPPAADYGQVLRSFIEQQVPRLEQGRKKALGDLKALMAIPAEKRADRIKQARHRFRGAVLAEILLEESHERVTKDTNEAFHLAELARTVIHHSPTVSGAFDLIALATAHMANACRAGGNLRKAEEHFSHTRYVISHEGVTDPETLARIDDLEGSLRRDQRLFREAEELFKRAAMLYRVGGSKLDSARAMMKLGDSYFHEGKLDHALDYTRQALKAVTRLSDPRLYMCGRYNLARFLVEAGQYQEASEILAVEADLFRRFPEPWTQLRVIWLRGKLELGRGELAAAEQAFLTAREGFIAEGIGYDAAMVSVEDLAPLYLRQGRTDDAKRLAEEMFPIFQAADVHREALAALLLFQEALRQETLTAKLARQFALYLRDARADHALQFRPDGLPAPQRS